MRRELRRRAHRPADARQDGQITRRKRREDGLEAEAIEVDLVAGVEAKEHQSTMRAHPPSVVVAPPPCRR